MLGGVFQVEKELLVSELDHVVPKARKSGYLLKENLDNKELETSVTILQQEPELKALLMELHSIGACPQGDFYWKNRSRAQGCKKV